MNQRSEDNTVKIDTDLYVNHLLTLHSQRETQLLDQMAKDKAIINQLENQNRQLLRVVAQFDQAKLEEVQGEQGNTIIETEQSPDDESDKEEDDTSDER